MHISPPSVVYLNGDYIPADEAKVSVLDRGFIFGDGVYEVIPVYGGRLFRLPHHLQRLQNGLDALRLPSPLAPTAWEGVLHELVQRNGGGDQSLYLQVTRGVAPRDHRFPDPCVPTLYAMSHPLQEMDISTQQGMKAITVEDIRWHRCDIKTIALLPNILLRQQAYDQGAGEALLVRDGQVTEGAASNLLMVKDGVIITPPKNNLLLPGITRDLILEIAEQHGIPYQERAITASELQQADELWVSSSTKEIIPLIELDGVTVGDGLPGPAWRQITALYLAYKQAFREGRVG